MEGEHKVMGEAWEPCRAALRVLRAWHELALAPSMLPLLCLVRLICPLVINRQSSV